jgi:hypothetical protein
MGQKRVLVCGALIVAAGIAVPTAALLGSDGARSEPRTPVVEDSTDSTPVVPPEPVDVPVGATVTTGAEPAPTSTARRVRAGHAVPPHTGVDLPPAPDAPQTRPPAGSPEPVESPGATAPATPSADPRPADPRPAPEPDRQPPTFVAVEPDPADDADGPPAGAPPALPAGEVDPADQ